jgi:CHAD domain-containing protein
MDAPPATLALELALGPDSLPPLRRQLAGALGRSRPLALTWHDRDGSAVIATQEGRLTRWHAETLLPPCPAVAPPPTPAPPPETAPTQHFVGRLREGTRDGIALRLVQGRIGTHPVARLTVCGPAAATAALARTLVAQAGLLVPEQTLAAEALALAGTALPARPLGAPVLPAGLAPDEAFAHAAAHLAFVLLHHAPAAAAGQTGEPVHQLRVALRRLRSLTRLFGAAVACPELTALAPALKTLASALGPARDWDVFLAETGRSVAGAFPDEPALAALIAAAGQRRDAAYAALPALLDGPALHGLVLDIAILAQSRPWPTATTPDLATFGAALLTRRLRPVTRRAADPAGLDEPALHALRLRAKRLRYAAEIFAPLHPGHAARRFLKRLAALQDALGLLNDGVVAALLMHDLADSGGTGLAGGMVRGFVAARAVGARAAIARSWRRLRKAGGFWA